MTTDHPDPGLFTPSLTDFEPPVRKRLPWRLNSQFWLAFLGGSVAVTAIAVLNARRLHMPESIQRRMVLGGALVTVIVFGLSWAAIVGFGLDPGRGARARLLPKWSISLVHLLWAAVLVRWQTPAARHYESFGPGDYDSMWLPGLLAAVVSFLVFGVPFLWLVWVTGQLR
jgi:hypothetical protein